MRRRERKVNLIIPMIILCSPLGCELLDEMRERKKKKVEIAS